jgi:phosphoribosylformylglycinamidine cyclo-ligase
LIEQGGKVDREEMYQVFNMGIGMTVVASAAMAPGLAKQLKGRLIGRIEKGSGRVRLRFP